MSSLTHAVFDALNGYVQVGDGHPDAATALADAARRGGPTNGYVVGPIDGLPGHRVTPKSEEVVPDNTEPMQAVKVNDPKGPGLFD